MATPIRAGALQNTFIGIEHLTEEELDNIRRRIETYATQAGNTGLMTLCDLEVLVGSALRVAMQDVGLNANRPALEMFSDRTYIGHLSNGEDAPCLRRKSTTRSLKPSGLMIN